MRILDKYILKQMLQPFAFGVAAFSTIFVASSFLFRVTQYITQYGASYSSLFRLFLCLMPEVINYTFPMSMLLASLLTMGQLSGNSEITAMRSGGMSFRRIAMPILAAGFVVSLFPWSGLKKLCRRRKPSMNASSSRKSKTTRNPVPRTISC